MPTGLTPRRFKILLCGVATLIAVLCACSQGTFRYIEILNSASSAPQVVYEQIRNELESSGGVSETQLCDNEYFMTANYSTTISNLRLTLLLNRERNLVGLQFLEYGVSSFSSQAEELYLVVVLRLRKRFTDIRVREHISDREAPAFGNRLITPHELPICVQ